MPYWDETVASWAGAMAAPDADNDPFGPHLLSLQVEPQRCHPTGDMIWNLICDDMDNSTESTFYAICQGNGDVNEISRSLGVRPGSVVGYVSNEDVLSVSSHFDHSNSIETA